MKDPVAYRYPLSPGHGGEGGGEGDASRLPPHASPASADAPTSRAPAPGATRARFPDGRWHFQHGPIDLLIGADGAREAVEAAVEHAWQRFQFILAELVGE